MSNDPVSIRLAPADLKAIRKLLKRYPYLKGRTAAISYALSEATKSTTTARAPDGAPEQETTA